jgi:hypothetical protein
MHDIVGPQHFDNTTKFSSSWFSFLGLTPIRQQQVNAPEWLLPRPLLQALAEEAGLKLDFALNFHVML